MKDKVLRRQWLPTRPSGIKHVCSNTITQCYEEQRRDPSQAAQHLVVVTMSQASASDHSLQKPLPATPPAFSVASGTDTLHGVATYQVDTRARKCAAQVGDNELLARLSMGDMVALEAKYHSKCLLALYYRAKTTVEAEPKLTMKV